MGASRRLRKNPKGKGKSEKKPPKPKFVPGFSTLGPSIYVQDPQLEATCADIPHRPTIPVATTYSSSQIPQSHGSADGPPPDLIIITSWTGAIPKHIAKYTQSYNQLFPQTPIMVITTSIADLAFHRTKTKLKVLTPAVTYLTKSNTSPLSGDLTTFVSPKIPKFTNILLHAFSEGGANKAVCLAQAFHSYTEGHRLPIAAFIFDSTPGTPRYSSNVAAFRRSLPRNKFAQTVGLPLGACVLGVTWVVFCIVVGYENNLISKTRRSLNDKGVWEVGRDIPRTYLFSESDDLIFWKDVEDHGVTSAQVCGARSLLVRFKSTGHCGHARGNEEVYWGAVLRTWESTRRGGGVVADAGTVFDREVRGMVWNGRDEYPGAAGNSGAAAGRVIDAGAASISAPPPAVLPRSRVSVVGSADYGSAAAMGKETGAVGKGSKQPEMVEVVGTSVA